MGQLDRILYLCGGLQSSGSTLISWCFLQRRDMDGFLDQRGDILANIPPTMGKPLAWCKFTINTFRFSEVRIHFEDEGWEVRPLLVIRDVRSVFNSLIGKSYGRNGVTGEEPPLRMRLRRFREDWDLFRANDWPIVRYESIVAEPEPTLRQACQKMELPWDEGMLSWPKTMADIAAPIHGNASFNSTREGNLLKTLNPGMAVIKTDSIPPADLTWIEQQFEHFNQMYGYPLHLPAGQSWTDPSQRAIPRWENTRRYKKRMKRNVLLRVVRAISSWAALLRGKKNRQT
jgi:hypothetical protein